MSNKIHVGAFFTKGTPYEAVLNEYLAPSCKQFNIPLHVIETDNYGSWVRNVAEKPKVIRTMLDFTYDGEVLVFLDADARIMKHPILFEQVGEEFDIGFHTLDWNSWYNYKEQPPKRDLLSGTMFFRSNDRTKDLCDEWYDIASKSSQWEQKVLQDIIGSHKVKEYELPVEYCYINSLPDGSEPNVKCDPVIVHYQKSRELKRIVNGKR